jgi:HNH endonuclease
MSAAEQTRVCRVDGCDRGPGEYLRHGYCDMHSQRVRKYGHPGEASPRRGASRKAPLTRRADGLCAVEGCDYSTANLGLCKMHLSRLDKYGEVGAAGRMKAEPGSGSLTPDGYRLIFVDGKQVKEHRHIMEQIIGRKLRRDESVHHINGIKFDNRPANLELWTGVGQQPRGAKVSDLLDWAELYVRQYAPEKLSGGLPAAGTNPFENNPSMAYRSFA